MKLERRSFISKLSVATAALTIGKPLLSAATVDRVFNHVNPAPNGVTIYHTGSLQGIIGSTATSGNGLRPIKSFIRQQKINGLLIDAGNFLGNGLSPLQNYRVVALMNDMGYLAAGVGGHELSGGENALAKLIPEMNFRLVNCNYRFGPALDKLIDPYFITFSGKIKIGITAVGDRVSGTGYNDPSASANNIARILKEQENCDMVVCLSRLGFSQSGDLPDNKKLAKNSTHIDFIIGENSSTPTDSPFVLLNKNKQEVLVSQAASNAGGVGRIACSFLNGKQKSNLKAKHFILG